MVDNPTAQARTGNIFNYVLVASERAKEIKQQRRNSGELALPTELYRNLPLIHTQVAAEIAAGTVGIEYLGKIRERIENRKRALQKMALRSYR